MVDVSSIYPSDLEAEAPVKSSCRIKSSSYLCGQENPLRGLNPAVVAQLVEHQLPKLRVAGSSPVSRSKGSARRIALLLYPHLSVCFICSLWECLLQGTALHSLDECGNSLYKQT